jgi:hypothetical protein
MGVCHVTDHQTETKYDQDKNGKGSGPDWG